MNCKAKEKKILKQSAYSNQVSNFLTVVLGFKEARSKVRVLALILLTKTVRSVGIYFAVLLECEFLQFDSLIRRVYK